jgi:arginine decarboxylase
LKKKIARSSSTWVPQKLFLTKGVGRHREKLSSFELALRNAGIAEFNLVKVSSIIPPHCQLISRNVGLGSLNPGQIIFCVLSQNATNEPHRLLAASIGVALPKNRDNYGYLSEHHSFGETERVAGDYAEDLAASMLAKTLGVEFDPDSSYDEKKEIWKISGRIVRTRNVTQSAVGNKKGIWTTVLAGAILML